MNQMDPDSKVKNFRVKNFRPYNDDETFKVNGSGKSNNKMKKAQSPP